MARFDASLSDVSFSFGPWPDSDAVHHHQPIGDVPVTWQLKRALTWVLWVLSRNLLSLVGSFWNRSRGPLWGDEQGFEVPRICWIVDTVIVRERKWQNANKLTHMPIICWQFLWELEEWWFNERSDFYRSMCLVFSEASHGRGSSRRTSKNHMSAMSASLRKKLGPVLAENFFQATSNDLMIQLLRDFIAI